MLVGAEVVVVFVMTAAHAAVLAGDGGGVTLDIYGFRSCSRRRWRSRHKRNLGDSWCMWLRRLSHIRCRRGKGSVVVKMVVFVCKSGQWV